ncbi:MAG: tRNA-dihydrouridine synthase [Parcubacteria group bacterium]|nr:tRNA-dihydrouridine synthase [Parcubacteria group bacterium]
MESFWKHLPKPFFVLAPMADVTDPAYRKLIAETGSPHVTWTEFVSADGLYHTREKKGMKDEENPLMRDLLFTPGEHPIVAQLFSSNPEMMEYAAKLCAELGFDGIDINMGCPDKSIEKQGCGAAMIKHPEVAVEIIRAAKKSGLPVSVKTRIGYNTEDIDGWLPVLLGEDIEALTVHLRTRKEMSKTAAHWELMPRVVALRDQLAPGTLIIGNGDVDGMDDARQKITDSGCDGIMFGRSIFGNPWLFTDRKPEDITPVERLDALASLARYFDEMRPVKSFHILKKHIKAFVVGWDGAPELRTKLMETQSVEELLEILSQQKESAI